MRFCLVGDWGIGIYFAQNASYYAESFSEENEKIFLANVLVGESCCCTSDENLRLPPVKPQSISDLNLIRKDMILYQEKKMMKQFISSMLMEGHIHRI